MTNALVRRLGIAGVTVAAAICFFAPPAQARGPLGGVSLDGYCQGLGYPQGAVLYGPVHAPDAAYHWYCVAGSIADPIGVTTACQSQYRRPSAYGRAKSANNAYSWRCYPLDSGVGPGDSVTYTTFGDASPHHTENLVPWRGRHVTLLVEPGPQRDPVVMTKLLVALDRAYSFYARATGRRPDGGNRLHGRLEIAEVSSTCGAGCGTLGSNGIEIQTQNFESMYEQVAEHDLYVQIPFYELGRDFWFWSDELSFQEPADHTVRTGYAVWMRFESMAASGVAGAPFGDTPFPTFKAQVAALAGQYESDPSLTFAGTLAQNRSPGMYGGTDFWASLMMQLASRHGAERFVRRFWHTASSLHEVSTTAQAVTNWRRAASRAACANLRRVFYVRWGFPRPDGSVSARPSASSVPEPRKHRCRSAG